MSNDIKHKPFVVWGGGVMSANSDTHKAVYTSNDIERERTISGWVIDNNDQIISGSGHNHSDANVFVNSGGTIYLYKPKCSTNMTCKYSIGTHPKINNADYIWYAVINDGGEKFTSACEYYYRNPNNLTQYKKHNLFEQNSDLSGYTFSGDNTVDYSFVSTGFDTTRGEFSAMTMPNATNWEMFKNCDNLVYVSIPCEMRKISQSSFKGCSNLASYSASTEFLTEIGDNAFSGCTSLKDLYVPKYASIGERSFANCSNASAITWYFNDNSMTKYNLTAIPDYAFANCTNLKTTNFVSLPYTTSGKTINCDDTIKIPSGITKIGQYAFDNCSSFKVLDLNGGVTDIDAYAFEKCTNLSSITSANSVTNIGRKAFHNCNNLSSSISAPSLSAIGESAFESCSKLRSITSASNLKTIGVSAFTNCTSLSSITVANSLTDIGNFAFKNCSRLTSIGLDSGSARIISGIGESAFENCTSLNCINHNGSSVWLQNVSEIGNNAFKNCINITSIGLSGNRAVTIGNYAFSGCTSLSSVHIYNSAATIGDYAFSGCTSLPESGNIRYADTYAVQATDKTLTSYTFNNNTKFIGDEVFKGCSGLTRIEEIPSGVTQIGKHAFEGCSYLEQIGMVNNECSIPNSVTYIGDYAFSGCNFGGTLWLGSGVTYIGDYAFYDTSFTDVIIPICDPPAIGEKIFKLDDVDTITVPKGCLKNYSGATGSASGWTMYTSIMVEG